MNQYLVVQVFPTSRLPTGEFKGLFADTKLEAQELAGFRSSVALAIGYSESPTDKFATFTRVGAHKRYQWHLPPEQAFMVGLPAGRPYDAVYTDGNLLYSCSFPIGRTFNGVKQVLDLRHKRSRFTTAAIERAIKAGAIIVKPKGMTFKMEAKLHVGPYVWPKE